MYVNEEMTNSAIASNWKIWQAYLRCVYQLPLSNTKYIISSFFMKMLEYLKLVTVEGADEDSDEDLLFGMPQTPKAEEKLTIQESIIDSELQNQMVVDVRELIGYLAMASDLAHIFLLSTQVQEYKCFPSELSKQVDMKLTNMMSDLARQKNCHPLGIIQFPLLS